MAIDLVAADYTAIVAASVVSFIIAFVWHGPLFGKMWASLSGVDMAKGKKGMPAKMLGAFITLLIFNFVLFQVLAFAGATAVADAAMVGFWVWLGFLATKEFGMMLWMNKPAKLFAINAIGSLITTVVGAAVLVSV